MKRLICLLMLAVLLLTGCGGKNVTPEAEEKTPVPQETTDSAKQPGKKVEKITAEEKKEDKREDKKDEAAGQEKEKPGAGSSSASYKDNGYPYYIKVNYQANTVTVYSKDDSGKYTVPCRAMICSTGTYTPRSGVYYLSDQYRWTWLSLQGNVYGQYCTQITGNILFHSVPYTRESKDSLEYWEFDKLGTACSAGCIRLQVRDAKWIYENKWNIYAVEFYASSDPGPLGKPSAPTISGNKACRNWDPTDPDSRNPWNKSENEPKVTVGSYVGKKEADAASAAKSLGLSVGSTSYEYSDKAKGTVIAQSLSSGASVKKGTSITFTVSKGPAPVTVGSYIGMTLDEARSAAQNAGLQVEITYQEGETDNIVVAQSLNAGESVARGSTITLTVSQVPETPEQPEQPEIPETPEETEQP